MKSKVQMTKALFGTWNLELIWYLVRFDLNLWLIVKTYATYYILHFCQKLSYNVPLEGRGAFCHVPLGAVVRQNPL